MSDEDDKLTDEEIAEAGRTRDALDDDPVVGALRAAWSPAAIDPVDHDAIVAGAVESAPADVEADPLVMALRAAWNPAPIDADEHREIVARAVGTNVIVFRRRARVAAVALAVVAVAAAFALRVTKVEEAPLARARSTTPLFDEPFRSGEASARIDKIALARAADYRDNRFAKWGVR